MRNGFIGLFATLAVAVTTASATGGEETRFCVAPVHTVINQTADLSREPRYIALPHGAQVPLIFDHYQVLVGGKAEDRQALWTLSENHELVGPRLPDHAIGDFLSDMPVLLDDQTLLTVARSYVEPEARWVTKLHHVALDGTELEIGSELAALDQVRILGSSKMLRAVIASAKVGNGATTLAIHDGSRATPILPDPGSVAGDLPNLGVLAVVDGSQLSLISPSSGLAGSIHLPVADERWESVSEMADLNWLYISGETFDYAVEIKRDAQTLVASRIVPVVVSTSIVGDGAFESTSGGTGLLVSPALHVGTCRVFSAVVRRPLYCDRSSSLVDGKLAKLSADDLEYVGDAPTLGISAFKASAGELWAYDGTDMTLVTGASEITRGRIDDLPSAGTAFLTSASALYRLQVTDHVPSAIRLDPGEAKPDLFTRLVGLPNRQAIFAFSRAGVFRVDGGNLVPLWKAGATPIDVTGHLLPTPIAAWNAILFEARASPESAPRFYSVEECAASK